MEIVRVRSWNGFVKAISDIRQKYGSYRRELDSGEVYKRSNNLLFRGQANAKWALETTLERASGDEFDVRRYFHKAARQASEIESFTGARWNVSRRPDFEKEILAKQDTFRVHLPSYDYLVYLRHLSFPSPLLDWTESPYIAAYFALAEPTKAGRAVYCYIERPTAVKGGTGGKPMITVKGPYVTTHKRHFAQKAWYTIATRWDSELKQHMFCSHERVFERNDPNQDLLFKIVIPESARRDGLSHLSDYNINHFTLFQTEDALIRALAMREFDLRT